ncbi:MAG: PIG-L deacetylase family protein [Armatimonadia bacterium]
MERKTLLVVGAHHDDCEYAAGGLILKAVQRGWRVVLVDMCGNHDSWKPTAGRQDEVRAALLELAAEMGAEKRFFDYGYHQIRYNDEAIRLLTDLVVEVQPDMGLLQWPHDYWPDHEACGKVGKHALWFTHGLYPDAKVTPKLLWYEAGPNQVDPAVPFRPDVYVDITDVKDEACRIIHRLDEIASGQTYSGITGHEQDKTARSRLRGGECGVVYAEAFMSLRKWPQDIL